MAITFVGVTASQQINGSGYSILLPSSRAARDLMIVAVSNPRNTNVTVTSSGGAAYFPLSSGRNTGTLYMNTYARFINSSLETLCTMSGTGNSQDGQAAVCMAFRDVDTTNYLDVAIQTKTVASGTQPSSPPLTVASSTDMIISAVASLVSETTPTGPSSYLNVTSTNSIDTRSVTTAMARINHNSTTPTSTANWASFLAAVSIGFSIALRETGPQPTWAGAMRGPDIAADIVKDKRTIRVRSYDD